VNRFHSRQYKLIPRASCPCGERPSPAVSERRFAVGSFELDSGSRERERLCLPAATMADVVCRWERLNTVRRH
jgi:hypothetical protein